MCSKHNNNNNKNNNNNNNNNNHHHNHYNNDNNNVFFMRITYLVQQLISHTVLGEKNENHYTFFTVYTLIVGAR